VIRRTLVIKAIRSISNIFLPCALLAACMTFPEPHGTQDSLIIGNLLFYPEGGAPRPGHGTFITFTDLTKKGEIIVDTIPDGDYQFVAKPGHKYQFKELSAMEGGFDLGPYNLNWIFKAEPGQISYLGHITVTCNLTSKKTTRTPCDYDLKASYTLNLDKASELVLKHFKSSGWFAYKIVPAKITILGNE
jgi:hypothetical protein